MGKLVRKLTNYSYENDKPADVTVAAGSLSRDARNDVKNGTSDISLMDFMALFDVSLVFLSSSYHQGKCKAELTTGTREW